MFNIGAAELIVILLVAFLVVGPKDLPKVARAVARGVKYLRNVFKEFQEETGLDEAMAELKDTDKQIKETLQEADVTRDLTQAKRDFDKALREANPIDKAPKGPMK